MSKAQQLTSGPSPIGSVSYSGLALITADGGAIGGFGPSVPDVRGELAWVFVYEIPKNPPHHCPAEPPSAVTSFPPLLPHYYSAIIVNAETGQTATWQEDESGLLERLCAGVPVGRAESLAGSAKPKPRMASGRPFTGLPAPLRSGNPKPRYHTHRCGPRRPRPRARPRHRRQ